MNEEGPSLAQPNVSPVSSESQTQFKKDLWTTPSQNAAGGQMITLSPPAGDPAGSQPEPGQGSSSAGSELTGDAEGVWSVDIDQAFQEALSIYPPCGRRKIIISDEGKMYGRNELIARYIKLRCGKTRTRKQVSSHIQVLARKKARDEHTKKKTPELPLSMPTPVAVSSAPTTTTARVPNIRPFPQLPTPLADAKERLELLSKAALLPPSMYQTIWPPFPMQNTAFPTELKPFGDLPSPFAVVPAPLKCESPVPAARKAIASSRLMLNGFTAYFEKSGGSADDRVEIVNIPPHVGDLERLPISDISDKYPKLLRDLFAEGPSDAFFLAKCWANTHFEITDADDIFAVDSYYTSESQFDISVSTKVCSFGNQVVEKIEVYPAEKKDDQFAFRLEKSAMCDYMVKFITELKKLDSEQWMNNVLENFTVLQVVTSTDTKETLMVLCFVFEVNAEPASMCSLFRLVQ